MTERSTVDEFDFDTTIIGLGYVGLPLAREASRAGLRVAGFDVSDNVVGALNAGRSHIDDLTDADVVAMLAAGFHPTTDADVLARTRSVIICVPTPLAMDGSPDLGSIEKAVTAIAERLRPSMLVVLESTTYPGTTDEVVRPLLEASGLQAGSDFHLAFSPERIDPGSKRFGVRNTPKVVGGHTAECADEAVALYSAFIDTVVRTKGTREAEMAKLLENTYRHVNIALVNEIAAFCHELDIDLWDVIDAAGTKPFGFQTFYPGPGVGGHCIPIDPNYLSHRVRTRLGRPFRFVELAQEINSSMPGYVAHRAQEALNLDGKALRGARILLLGVSYKAGISDTRETPATPLARKLQNGGAVVGYHDPRVPEWSVDGDDVLPADDLLDAVAKADLVIVLQNHPEYDVESIAARAQRLLDTRGTVTPAATAHRL